MEWFVLPAFTVLSTLLSVVFTFFYVRSSSGAITSLIVENTEELKENLQKSEQYILDSFEPVINNNKKVMGIINQKSVDSRQEKAAIKALGQDVINSNAVMIEGVRAVSPMFAERLEGNPDLILKLMPRIKQLLGNTDIEALLSGGKEPSNYGDHPFKDER